MDVPLASGGRLTAAEIGDLADEFPTPELASRVLEAAGLPPGRHPRWQVGTARQFWNEVANLIAHGALADGRANLVAAVAAARLEGLFDTTPSTWDLPSPASLLRPSWGAVEFYGRTEELSLLERWCEEDDGSPVRLVVGPGGQGKTRLGLRLCAAWRARGWDAGLLSPSAGAVAMDAAAVSERPLLVVVDYAEARQVQLGLLLERLVRRRSRRRRRRILLLARSASDDSQWWASLRARYPDVCATVVPEPLPPLDPESADRAGSYRQVLTDLAEAWRAVSRDVDWPGLATRLVVPDDLSESTYELALALQTRALTDLLQAGPDPAEGTGPGREFADVLLDHERRYWADSAGARGLAPLPYPMSLLGRAVAAAALCGAADERQAWRPCAGSRCWRANRGWLCLRLPSGCATCIPRPRAVTGEPSLPTSSPNIMSLSRYARAPSWQKRCWPRRPTTSSCVAWSYSRVRPRTSPVSLPGSRSSSQTAPRSRLPWSGWTSPPWQRWWTRFPSGPSSSPRPAQP